MSNLNLRGITNSFQDVRLASLASWKRANEFQPRDHGGPYVVLQEGYDPMDLLVRPDEFILGRSGKWLALGLFYQMPEAERRAEFVFGTAAEIMTMMSALPPKVAILRPGETTAAPEAPAEPDEMASAIQAGKAVSPAANQSA